MNLSLSTARSLGAPLGWAAACAVACGGAAEVEAPLVSAPAAAAVTDGTVVLADGQRIGLPGSRDQVARALVDRAFDDAPVLDVLTWLSQAEHRAWVIEDAGPLAEQRMSLHLIGEPTAILRDRVQTTLRALGYRVFLVGDVVHLQRRADEAVADAGDHFTVEAAALVDLPALCGGCRVAPHRDAGGAVDGYRVSGIVHGSPGAALGLFNGDLLRAIDDAPLTSMDAAQTAVEAARGAESFTLAITRRDKPVLLTYEVR